jgi:PTH2 family peptidyl-tRNA hydrolase
MPVAKEDHLYQYAIIRRDLDMPPGKLSAQAGHAYTDSLDDAEAIDPERVSAYRNAGKGGSKVTLKARNVNQILKAYKAALEAGLPCALIVDQHHVLPPHFDGKPIITALGIGPCTRDECRHITKKFNCV